MLGELTAMVFWAVDCLPNTLTLAALLLLSVILAVFAKEYRYVFYSAALIFCGLQAQSVALVPRATLELVKSKISGAELRIIAPPSFSMPGSARVRVDVPELNSIRGVVQYPDLPWGQLNVGEGSIIHGRLKQSRHFSGGTSWPDSDVRHGIAFRGQLSDVQLSDVQLHQGERISSLRLKLVSSLIEQFDYSRALAVVISASAGFGGLLDDQTIDLFKQTGLYHVLVVSGSHVSFVYLVVRTAIIQLMSLSWVMLTVCRLKVVGAIAGFLVTAAFVNFTGLEPPAVRALFALFIFLLAELLLRSSGRAESYLYVVGAMLLVYPGCFLDAGPMLTFAAVLGLQLAFQLLKLFQNEEDESGIFQKIVAALFISFVVWLFTAPWLCLFFDRLSPLSFLFNLAFGAIFSGVVCVGGLIIGALFAFGIPSQLLISGLCWATEWIVQIIDFSYNQTVELGAGEIAVEPRNKALIVALFLIVNIGLVIFQARKNYMLHRYCISS